MSEFTAVEHKAAFAQTVCVRCGLCQADVISPDFCMLVYDGDENRFLGFIYQIQRLRKSRIKANLASFESFCGLFCNSFPPCPQKSKACDELKVRISCYGCFVKQWGQTISQKVLLDIYELFSGVDLNTLGTKLSFDLRRLKKKEKKAMRHASRQTMNVIGTALAMFVDGKTSKVSKKIKVTKLKKRKAITTTMLINDNDQAWSDKIKELLNTKENYDDEADD